MGNGKGTIYKHYNIKTSTKTKMKNDKTCKKTAKLNTKNTKGTKNHKMQK